MSDKLLVRPSKDFLLLPFQSLEQIIGSTRNALLYCRHDGALREDETMAVVAGTVLQSFAYVSDVHETLLKQLVVDDKVPRSTSVEKTLAT